MKKTNDKINIIAGKAGIWYTFGNIILKGCLFLTLPIFTRILSASDFGIYNTYMAYEGILTAILGLGLYGTVKNAKLDFKEKFNDYMSSVLSFSLLAFLFVIIVLNVFYPFYYSKLGFSRIIVNCLIFQSFGGYLIYFYGAKLNIEFKYRSYVVISFFNTIGNIVFSILLIKYIFPNLKYLGRIIGSATPLILLSMVIIWLIFSKSMVLYNKEYWKYAIIIGLPLVPHAISHSILTQFDRIMISNMVGKSEAGIYSYIYTICTIVNVLIVSLENAWTSWVYVNLNNNEKSIIKEISVKYVLFFATITIGFICVMPEVLKIIVSEEYREGSNLLIPLTLANYCIFLYMLPVGIEYYNKKTKYISIGTIFCAILNFIFNYFSIKYVGYKSAAYTTLVSYFLLFLFHYLVSLNLKIKEVYNMKKIIIISIFVFSLSFCLLTIEKYSSLNFIFRYLIITVILIYYYRNKEFLFKILKRNK